MPDRLGVLEWLKDAENAGACLEAVLVEGDPAGLLQALRNVADGNQSQESRLIGTDRLIAYGSNALLSCVSSLISFG